MKLPEAEAIMTALAKWPAGQSYASSDFGLALRIAQKQQAVHASLTDANAWADYGRALLDAGRTDEAIEKLKKAVSLDPTLTSAKDNLQFALTQLQGATSTAPKDLDAEIASTAQVIGDGKSIKDFFTWHRYALLLFRKGWQQQQANSQTATTTFTKTEDVITEALKCGRSGKDTLSEGQNYGIFGYYGSKVVGISGFAYPEGNADFVLLQGLHVIKKQPQDYLAYLSMAMALLELKQTDIASAVLQKCLALKPDCTEAKYASGLVTMQQGQRNVAIAKFNEVLKANPRHTGAKAFMSELGAVNTKPDTNTRVVPQVRDSEINKSSNIAQTVLYCEYGTTYYR